MSNNDKIPFNRPFIAGKELFYIAQSVTFGNMAGDGHFTKACCALMEKQFQTPKVLLTPSCTAALEMCALLADLKAGDEVIMPSYTFVSTANAVALRGARPVFVDIRPDTLNINENLIEDAITPRTKAIFPVHYAGVSCEMDRIMAIAEKHDLIVAEDAAQGVNSYYHGRALGTIGHLGCYSFHETKNYICGEGGALCINDDLRFADRSEIIRDKGTNRRQFFRGQVDKYTWVDLGSSYVPSEIVSAFLYGQLELLDEIRNRRKANFDYYHAHLSPMEAEGLLRRPIIPYGCETNYHMYYILLEDAETRNGLMKHLNQQGIMAVFHYIPLHSSPMGLKMGYAGGELPVTEDISARLLRLPLFYEITPQQQETVVNCIRDHLMSRKADLSKKSHLIETGR
jgi:dTDP-4-amino-4,6-dideoxygalactose transaminase